MQDYASPEYRATYRQKWIELSQNTDFPSYEAFIDAQQAFIAEKMNEARIEGASASAPDIKKLVEAALGPMRSSYATLEKAYGKVLSDYNAIHTRLGAAERKNKNMHDFMITMFHRGSKQAHANFMYILDYVQPEWPEIDNDLENTISEYVTKLKDKMRKIVVRSAGNTMVNEKEHQDIFVKGRLDENYKPSLDVITKICLNESVREEMDADAPANEQGLNVARAANDFVVAFRQVEANLVDAPAVAEAAHLNVQWDEE